MNIDPADGGRTGIGRIDATAQNYNAHFFDRAQKQTQCEYAYRHGPHCKWFRRVWGVPWLSATAQLQIGSLACHFMFRRPNDVHISYNA